MASLFMRFPCGKAKAVTLSYDDGVDTDIRLMEILDKHGLKCSFNINAGQFSPEGTKYPETRSSLRMSQSQCIEAYKNSGHEVACHGLTHSYLDTLPKGRAVYELIEDRRRIEEMFGHTVRGFAVPFSSINDSVVQMLKDAGYAYARGGASTHNFELPENFYKMANTCRHKDPELMNLADQFLNRQNIRKPILFSLMGHSFEFKNDNNWEVIEQFAGKIGDKEDIWYAPIIKIVDYINAYKQLRFTVNMDLVENPTSKDLYFEWKGKNYTVKSGESLKIN